jgi:uncharacterized membrane protein YhfC
VKRYFNENRYLKLHQIGSLGRGYCFPHDFSMNWNVYCICVVHFFVFIILISRTIFVFLTLLLYDFALRCSVIAFSM